MRLQGKLRILPLILLALLIAAPLAAAAQDNVTVVTLAVPSFLTRLFTPELLAEFEAANPGIRAQVVEGDFPGFASAANDLDTHLDAVEKYVSTADVIYIDSDGVSVEATRAGYFLDLTPLASADPTLNTDDFIPAAWESLQWDNGIWGIPVSVDVATLVYDKDAFDAAGLAYPTGSWTIDDLATAARTLAEKDPNGTITTPGLALFGNYTGLLLRGLLGQPVYDESVIPAAPDFSNPALESLLTTLNDLETEGVITTNFSGQIDSVPMRIIGSFGMNSFNPNQQPPGSAPLPGDVTGLTTQNFAISGGTLHPEAAYALAKFLSQRPEIAVNFFGAVPARTSLRDVQPPPPDDAGGGAVFVGGAPINSEAVDAALEKAIPTSEQRFVDYLSYAVEALDEGTDARTALDEAEAKAVSNLQAAADRRSTLSIVVATPIPDVVLAPGEVSLNFGMQSNFTPIPNREEWNRVIQDFIAADPQVGDIQFDAGFDVRNRIADYDCYVLPYNNVPEADLTTLLALDPYLDADPSFDRNDVVGDVLTQLARDGRTWALPLVITPEAMRYNSELFQQAGVPLPENGWTIEEFTDALRQLDSYLNGDAPFSSQGVGGTYMLQLIAAYGGMPVDYRTNPPTLNFTDPTTVEAIRQVLELAKEGLIDYQELAATGAMMISIAGADQERPPIYTETLNLPGMNVRVGEVVGQDPYLMTTYPTGSNFNAITYGMNTAYINATAQNADACYRWISEISRHPELFSGMPARRSLINDPTLSAARPADETSFYNRIDALLNDPNTVEFPSAFADASPASFLMLRWLEQVFDSYVLHDGDLEADLANAQVMSQTFQDCVTAMPAYDPATEDERSYFQGYIDCAVQADPTMADMFTGPG